MDMGKEFDAGYVMGLVAGEGYFAGHRSSWGVLLVWHSSSDGSQWGQGAVGQAAAEHHVEHVHAAPSQAEHGLVVRWPCAHLRS